jgi:hypothetical protein
MSGDESNERILNTNSKSFSDWFREKKWWVIAVIAVIVIVVIVLLTVNKTTSEVTTTTTTTTPVIKPPEYNPFIGFWKFPDNVDESFKEFTEVIEIKNPTKKVCDEKNISGTVCSNSVVVKMNNEYDINIEIFYSEDNKFVLPRKEPLKSVSMVLNKGNIITEDTITMSIGTLDTVLRRFSLGETLTTLPPIIKDGKPIISCMASPECGNNKGCYDGYDGGIGGCYEDTLKKSCEERGYTVDTGLTWHNYPYAKIYSKP